MTNTVDTFKMTKFTGVEAREFIRELWVSFNSFNMYGAEHPAARKGVQKLYDQLKKVLVLISRLTLHNETGTLYCEEWQIDRSVDVKRLTERMNHLGIHTISFFEAIRPEDLMELIKIIIDARKFREINGVLEYLKENKIRGFVFNYYTYKKIPSGGFQVQEHEDTQVPAAPGEKPAAGRSSAIAKLLEEFLRDQPGLVRSFSEKLRSVRTRFESGGGPAVDTLRDTIAQLNTLLGENDLYGSDTGVSPEEWSSTLTELDSLTIAIMSRAVMDALQGEEQPIKGMAGFFRKMDPSLEFTMKALPRIKNTLLANGITLLQYLQFIQSVADEITPEEFKSLLRKTGSTIGVTNQEIMQEIEKNRDELIPLATLAIKLETLVGDSAKPMMNFLYQHAEKELRGLTMNNLAGKTIEKKEDIDPYLEDARLLLLRKLAERGMILKIVQDLNNLILRRKEALWGLTWAQYLVESTGTPDQMPDGEGLRLLADKIKVMTEGTNLINPILYVLEEKGLARELLNRFLRMITGKKILEPEDIVSQAEVDSAELPPGMISQQETLRFLEMEISRNLRYHTPFSCISISVPGVATEKQLREPNPGELAAIFLEITCLLKNSLRNLDFIGTLGTLTDNHIFVIMTMTGGEGCLTVAMRLGEGLKSIAVEVDGKMISAQVNMSAVTYNPEETPDMQSFLRHVKSRHREQGLAMQV